MLPYIIKEVFLLEINTILADMPCSIKSYVIANADMSFTIVLNSALSYEQNKQSYLHEYAHIINKDHNKKCSVDIIELEAHQG